MSLHEVTFTYNLPETGVMEIDIDTAIDTAEKELLAIDEIRDVFDDITDLEIVKVSEIV